VVVLIAATSWLLWRRAATPALPSGACRGCNVLLITIDTLRVDRVGAFGGRPGLTPNLDRLASEGFRFTRAYSSAPLTLPAHASILTAVSPPVHGLRANGLFGSAESSDARDGPEVRRVSHRRVRRRVRARRALRAQPRLRRGTTIAMAKKLPTMPPSGARQM